MGAGFCAVEVGRPNIIIPCVVMQELDGLKNNHRKLTVRIAAITKHNIVMYDNAVKKCRSLYYP